MFKYACLLYKVDSNLKESSRYFKMAANKGHVRVMLNYWCMLFKCEGIKENKIDASRHLKMDADAL